ncbi:hypothetical protein [Cohnella soli]|uniref:Uncharacterized protein n=1 Tax=Cohnella soli TaxID=425005 RepID=A0ABW0HN08_9BACL
MFKKNKKPSIPARVTQEFVELLLLRLIGGENLDSALSSLSNLRFPSKIFELLDVDADLLLTELDNYSGHFVLLCAVLQEVKHEEPSKIADALALLKMRMVDLLYSLGQSDPTVFHSSTPPPKQYVRDMLQVLG